MLVPGAGALSERAGRERFYERYELPTVALGLLLYACWLALTRYHASVPGWLLFLAGGYVTQWHFSLQHESIHNMRNWPAWLRTAYVWPPLGMLRTFIEHRYGTLPMERVAIVQSNTLMGVLFLYNNIHLVHHQSPTLPWYRIPARFRAGRDQLLATNGNFYFRGYVEIARRFLFKPVFDPVHPKW